MKNISELELLGAEFINLEIDVLNETNTSIFENGIYNKKYLDIEEWNKGIKTFLMYERESSITMIKQTKSFYKSLAELVNKAYIRHKEMLGDVDRLVLKINLQVSEILEQENKIINLERYQNCIEVQENLNKLVLINYKDKLEQLNKVINIKSFKVGDLHRTKEKIQKVQKIIQEATERQQSYEKEKEKFQMLEELKKNQNSTKIFFDNKNAVISTIKVLNNCCDYYYRLIYLREFIKSLQTLNIYNHFSFMNPFDLMSYEKLKKGLTDLLELLNGKGMDNKEFNHIANRFIGVEILNLNKSIACSDKKTIATVNEYERILADIRKKFELFYREKENIVHNVLNLEEEFIHTLSEMGW